MKLNKLASAVSVSLAALALTACGSSDDDQPIPNTPATVIDGAQNAVDQAKIDAVKAAATKAGLDEADAAKFANANKDIDVNSPAFEEAIAKFNEDKAKPDTSTDVGSNNVISDKITKNDPWLAGFDSSKVSSVQSSHYVRHADSNFDRARNPDSENTGNSGIMAHATLENKYLTNYILSAEGDKEKVWAVSYIGEYYDKDKKEVVGDEFDVIEVEYTYAKLDGTTASSNDDNGFKVETSAQVRGTIQEHDGAIIEAKDAVFADFAKGELADFSPNSGLYSAKQKVSLRNTDKVEFAVKNIEDELGTKVALFGKNKGKDSSQWLDGDRVNTTDKIEAEKANGKVELNSYRADFNDKGELTDFNPIRLVNTQYGRLTTHIDALAKDPSPDTNGYVLIPRPFVEKGTKEAVDVYFYRGTNETTETQMNKVIAEANSAVLAYRGHALTHGLENDVLNVDKKIDDKSYTNAFGSSASGFTKEAFGNFVEARFDTGTGKVNGEIYNFVRLGSNESFKKNDLVSFEGDVHINTVLGSATRKATEEVGNFRGSFFGQGAEELGGNISSVKDGYGVGAWGAVFGAEKVKVEGPQQDPAKGTNYDVNDTTAIDKKGP